MSLSDLIFNNQNLLKDVDEQKFNTTGNYVHIRIQQRNGRKSLTTIQGLALDLDLKKIIKYMKHMFSTNGAIIKDDDVGSVIQLQGDQRKNCQEFLTLYKVCDKDEIKVHGF